MDEQELKNIEKQRRIRIQARAILQRAKEAGVPDDMRIDKNTFRSLLCERFHGGKKKCDELSEEIFTKANTLFSHPFIIIDGGNMNTRRKAGFALLFRMIACDKTGKYEGFREFINTLSTFTKFGVNRTEYIEMFRNYDTMFLGEFDFKQNNDQFTNNFGGFIDDVFESRHLEHKPTIISWMNPLASVSGDKINENTYGQYMSLLSQVDFDNTAMPDVLRIRITTGR